MWGAIILAGLAIVGSLLERKKPRRKRAGKKKRKR